MSATSQRRVFDAADPDVNAYRLLTALVVPRPIAWVSTLSAAGEGNLAPHSFFTVASAAPPVVQFTSVGHHDSLRNVTETGEFVVSLVDRAHMDAANDTSARFPHGVDEAAALGIVMEPSARVAPPRVAGSPASIECRLHCTLSLGQSTLVLGSVLALTVREDVLDDGHPDVARLQPVSRLGRDEWGLPPEAVRMRRPSRPEEVLGRG